jgi:hypothetical protein
MKINLNLGNAKYETSELIVGIILNVIGGIFIGKSFEDFSLAFILPAIITTLIGILLEIRVLKKHIHDLRLLKSDLFEANKKNLETIEEMKHQKNLIENANEDLEELNVQIKNQIDDLEKIKKDVFSSSITGRSFGSLEDAVRRVRDRVQKIEEKLGLSSFGNRRYPW